MVAEVSGERRHTLAPPGDFVLPFDLPDARLRGRIVRLDEVATRALAAHPLPEIASRALGETLALAGLLGSSLKLEGRLSIQTRSEGPLGLIVSDFFAGGGLRGYARYDADRAAGSGGSVSFGALAGDGHLAITIERAPGTAPYQGVVALDARGLAASAERYFAQSEQLATAIRLAAGPVYAGGSHGWRAGGIMVQATPNLPRDTVTDSDDWRRVALYLASIEDYELLDTAIAAEDVLWRLFHEDGVRVMPVEPLGFRCTCGPEKVEPVLKSYGRSDLAELADVDGVIRAKCEFCGAVHAFRPDEIAI